MFSPTAVVVGSFIKTSMTCSHTGRMEGGSEGVIRVGMLAGGMGRGEEASGGGAEPKSVSGDTRPLGSVDMMVKRWRPVPNFFWLGLERKGDDAGVLTQSVLRQCIRANVSREWESRVESQT